MKRQRKMINLLIFGFIFIVVALYLAWRWNTKPQLVVVHAQLPVDFSCEKFSHTPFKKLLQQYVDNAGNVDYSSWRQDRTTVNSLQTYLAMLAKCSPENAPQQFDTANTKLIYWVYAYNAQVINLVLSHPNIDSVTDLKAPIEIIKGLGFFYNFHFVIGGKSYNLYQIENDKILSANSDPRIHFVLNCGSQSCPALRPSLPMGSALEPFLDKAASEFIASTKNLSIDHHQRRIFVSAIFEWYKKDFIRAAEKKLNRSTPSIIDYLQMIADPELSKRLGQAQDYQLVFMDYNWQLNQQPTQKHSQHPNNSELSH